MSVVIVGGHDRMVCQYMKIWKNYKCKAKIFTQMSASMDKQMGTPDLFILFTNTVSHKMVKTAENNVKIRCFSLSNRPLVRKIELLQIFKGKCPAGQEYRRSRLWQRNPGDREICCIRYRQ